MSFDEHDFVQGCSLESEIEKNPPSLQKLRTLLIKPNKTNEVTNILELDEYVLRLLVQNNVGCSNTKVLSKGK